MQWTLEVVALPVSDITVFDERDGGTFFGFNDPDGNAWSVQEIRARATSSGREWAS